MLLQTATGLNKRVGHHDDMRFVFKTNSLPSPKGSSSLFGVSRKASSSSLDSSMAAAGIGAYRVKECLTAITTTTTEQQTSELFSKNRGLIQEMCEDPNNQEEEEDSCSEVADVAPEDNKLTRMIRTIHDQQQHIQKLGRRVITRMESVKSATNQELALKSLLDECSIASHAFWKTIHEKEKRVAQLKQQLQALRARQNPTLKGNSVSQRFQSRNGSMLPL